MSAPTNSEKPSLVKAIINFFGMSNSEAVKEFKALTPQDKDDFVDMFNEIGIEVTRPVKLNQ